MRKLIIISLAFCTVIAYAGTYKWVDESGKIHYSSTPPADAEVKTTKIKTHTKPSSSQEEEIKAFEEYKAQVVNEQLEAIKAAEQMKKQEERRAIKLKNCNTAKRKLASYTENVKIRYQKENGEWAFMSDDVRTQRAKEAQSDVEHYCSEEE